MNCWCWGGVIVWSWVLEISLVSWPKDNLTSSCFIDLYLEKILIVSSFWPINLQAIQQLQGRTPHAQSAAAGALSLSVFSVGAALDIFQTLIVELDTEGRYLFLNAIANQLRYPNTHTHYFSFILLYLFAESNQVGITEFWLVLYVQIILAQFYW